MKAAAAERSRAGVMLVGRRVRGIRTMIRHRWLPVAAAFVCSAAARATEVAVCTDEGRFVIELAEAKAPKHVENFLRYVDMGFYTGTVFHRVAPSFVVEGGGVDRKLLRKP